jgi:hypothetical protein
LGHTAIRAAAYHNSAGKSAKFSADRLTANAQTIPGVNDRFAAHGGKGSSQQDYLPCNDFNADYWLVAEGGGKTGAASTSARAKYADIDNDQIRYGGLQGYAKGDEPGHWTRRLYHPFGRGQIGNYRRPEQFPFKSPVR